MFSVQQKRKKKSVEFIDVYVAVLCNLSKKCTDFATVCVISLWSLLLHIVDKKTQQELLSNHDLNLTYPAYESYEELGASQFVGYMHL